VPQDTAVLRLKGEFNSDMPRTVDGLCSAALPGVGPKMVSLCLHVVWDICPRAPHHQQPRMAQAAHEETR